MWQILAKANKICDEWKQAVKDNFNTRSTSTTWLNYKLQKLEMELRDTEKEADWSEVCSHQVRVMIENLVRIKNNNYRDIL